MDKGEDNTFHLVQPKSPKQDLAQPSSISLNPTGHSSSHSLKEPGEQILGKGG